MKHTKKVLCLLAAMIFALSAASCSFTTAKVVEPLMTESIDAEGKPGNVVTSYTADTDALYASAKLMSAPNNTKVRVVWTYVTGNQTIDEVMIDSGDIADRYIYSNLEPTATLPTGDYKVEFFVEDKKEPDATVTFTITPVLASIEDAHMTSFMDVGGEPADTITTVEPTGTWYVSAILRNTQPDTTIRFVWKDTTGAVIDEYTFDPEGKSDIYIGGTLQLSQVAPDGTYQVEIYLDDKTEPETTVSFDVKAIDAESSAAANADYSEYSQTEAGFSISYPTDWESISIPENLAAGFYPEEYVIDGEDEVNAVVVVKVLDVGYSTQEALDEWIAETEAENNENYASLDSTIEKVNGRDMAMYAYTWTRSGYNLVTFDFLVVNGVDLYVITFTSTQEALDTLYPYVEQMVLSFKIL
ncbi:MAG: PsbP-related protein [Clostridiaceae bacterium]